MGPAMGRNKCRHREIKKSAHFRTVGAAIGAPSYQYNAEYGEAKLNFLLYELEQILARLTFTRDVVSMKYIRLRKNDVETLRTFQSCVTHLIFDVHHTTDDVMSRHVLPSV